VRWETVTAALRELPEDVLGKVSASCSAPRLGDYWDTERLAVAYTDLSLGWKIASACAALGRQLPTALASEDEVIFRAWCSLASPGKYRDTAVTTAKAWHTDMRFSKTVKTDLQALLIAKQSTIGDVAQALKLPWDHVNAYQVLFFNIMGRKEDLAWLKQFVYPDTKMVEFYADYLEQPEARQLLMRAGYNNGVEHVLQLSGISTDPVSALGASGSASQMEAFLMANAMLMASSGWFNNQKHATAIFHARHLMTAAKLGGDNNEETPPLASMASVVSEELLRAKKPQAEQALRLTLASDQFGSGGRALIVDAPPPVTDIESSSE